jgi:hypothetical protein
MSIVLHGNGTWTSPFVLSVFVALREKGLPHDVPSRIRAYAEAQWKRPAVVEFCAHERAPFQASVML